MIQVIDKNNCCGCNACAQRCPKQCIAMQEDNEGFLYPSVDKINCIDCGLCEKVCPIINQQEAPALLGVYAAKNNNEEVRRQSSSGGVFTFLAEKVIDEGGVVFGARFNQDWEVVHSYTETKDGLAAFRGSKYVQSVVGDTYKDAERFLKEGRKVLYSGTPCQIAGLKHYLRKEYENLLAVECICHSVPSPLVWKKYLNKHSQGRAIKRVNFRDKSTGWSYWKYSLVIHYKNGDEEIIPGGRPYMKALAANLTVRPSCSSCKARDGKSGSDLSLGDFWGIWNISPEIDDNKGTTIVFVYNEKGLKALEDIQLNEVAITNAKIYNRGLRAPDPLHINRGSFFNKLCSCNDIDSIIESSLHITLLDRIKRIFTNI